MPGTDTGFQKNLQTGGKPWIAMGPSKIWWCPFREPRRSRIGTRWTSGKRPWAQPWEFEVVVQRSKEMGYAMIQWYIANCKFGDHLPKILGVSGPHLWTHLLFIVGGSSGEFPATKSPSSSWWVSCRHGDPWTKKWSNMSMAKLDWLNWFNWFPRIGWLEHVRNLISSTFHWCQLVPGVDLLCDN
jgi:hypothetical protein